MIGKTHNKEDHPDFVPSLNLRHREVDVEAEAKADIKMLRHERAARRSKSAPTQGSYFSFSLNLFPDYFYFIFFFFQKFFLGYMDL